MFLQSLNIEYQSGGYWTFNIEYQYGGYSKFKLKNEIFEKLEYRISIWLILDIQYPVFNIQYQYVDIQNSKFEMKF